MKNNISFDYVPSKMYIGEFHNNSRKFPLCSFSKDPIKGYKPFSNEPVNGFTFCYGGSAGSYLIDPRGFCLIVSNIFLMKILSSGVIVNGEIIGRYQWVWKDNSFLIEKEDVVKEMNMSSEEDIMKNVEFSGEIGRKYVLPNGNIGIYIGRCYQITSKLYSRRSINNKISISYGDDVEDNIYFFNEGNYTSFDFSNDPSHIFVVEKEKEFEYVKFSYFTTYGSDGMYDGNVSDLYKCVLPDRYFTRFSKYILYDKEKFYSNSKNRINRFVRKIDQNQLSHIESINQNFNLPCVKDNKVIGAISADGKQFFTKKLEVTHNFSYDYIGYFCFEYNGKKSQKFYIDYV